MIYCFKAQCMPPQNVTIRKTFQVFPHDHLRREGTEAVSFNKVSYCGECSCNLIITQGHKIPFSLFAATLLNNLYGCFREEREKKSNNSNPNTVNCQHCLLAKYPVNQHSDVNEGITGCASTAKWVNVYACNFFHSFCAFSTIHTSNVQPIPDIPAITFCIYVQLFAFELTLSYKFFWLKMNSLHQSLCDVYCSFPLSFWFYSFSLFGLVSAFFWGFSTSIIPANSGFSGFWLLNCFSANLIFSKLISPFLCSLQLFSP